MGKCAFGLSELLSWIRSPFPLKQNRLLIDLNTWCYTYCIRSSNTVGNILVRADQRRLTLDMAPFGFRTKNLACSMFIIDNIVHDAQVVFELKRSILLHIIQCELD